MYIKIDNNHNFTMGEILNYGLLSGIKDLEAMSRIASLNGVSDETFYTCVDEIKDKAFFDEDEYILVKREMFEELMEIIKEQNKKYWQELMQELKEECGK